MNDMLAPDALALHRALVTLDTHIDIPWPPGPAPFEDGPRKVDMPKMRRGGMSAGCFVAYVPQAARSPASEDAAFARAIAMLDHINAMGRTENAITARVTASAPNCSFDLHGYSHVGEPEIKSPSPRTVKLELL